MRALFAAVLCSAVLAGTLYLGSRSVGAFDGAPTAASSGLAEARKANNARKAGKPAKANRRAKAVPREAYVIRFNKRDQAAARAAVLRRADFGAGWKGGAKKPNVNNDSSACPYFRPRANDIVITGAAEAEFEHPGGLWLNSETHVVGTPEMEAIEWKRIIQHPNFVRCLRETFRRELPASGGRLISVQRVPFPKIAPHVVRIRAISEYVRSGRKVRTLLDMVAIGKGRSELTLLLAAPLRDRALADQAELRVARILVGRARA